MRYLDRFKARVSQVSAAYAATNEYAPKRPIEVESDAEKQAVNVLVDVMLSLKMKGLDFDPVIAAAQAWTEYEWEQVEPLVEAARAARAQAAAA